MATEVGRQIGEAIVAYLPTQAYRDYAVTAGNCEYTHYRTEEVIDYQGLKIIVQVIEAESEPTLARASYYQKTYTLTVRIQEPQDAARADPQEQQTQIKVLAEDIEKHLFSNRQPQAGVACLGVTIPGDVEGFQVAAQQKKNFYRLLMEVRYRHILKA